MEKTGSLFFEGGVDVDKLYREIDKMNREIKQSADHFNKQGGRIGGSFDNIGLSARKLIGPASALAAAYKFQQIASEAYQFEKEFGMAMREVQTISKAVQDDIEGISKRIVDLAANGPDDAIKLSKAFYQIVSAGYDGEAGLKLLEVSSKAATAGITNTTVAADGLTTVLNAWGISADKAGVVADVMFKTVERGKTTFGELASYIAQVAPLAAANNISFEEIFAALQTITKQGTPTAQAMTQIRSSIVNMNKVLGDGWSDVMTYQEGLQKVRDMAGGSQNKLKELIPDVEGVNAVLATTGEKAAGAAEDLNETAKAAGAMGKAYGAMMEEANNKWAVVHNKWTREIRELGKALKEGSGDIATFLDALLSAPGDEDFLKYFEKRIDGFAGRLKVFKELGNGMISSLVLAAFNSNERVQNNLKSAFKNEYDLKAYQSKLDAIVASTGTFEEKQKRVNDEFNRFVKYLETGEEKEMVSKAIEIASEYSKNLNKVNNETDGQIGKVRTLKDMLEDLKNLQNDFGTGTMADDLSTLAKIETIKQEIRDYYDKIREIRKVDAVEKVTPVSGKNALGGYQDITKEQVKQEFQGKKILKLDEASRKEAEKKNKEIEEQNSRYLKQVKIVEQLQGAFTDASEVLGALSYAAGELDQDAGQALGKMADLAYNASNLVTAIGSKDMLGAATSSIGMLGNVFALIKGDKESYSEKLSRTLSEINEALSMQSQLLAQLSGQDWFELAARQAKKLEENITSTTAELNKMKIISKEDAEALKGLPVSTYWVEKNYAINTDGWTVEDWVKAYSEGAEVIDKNKRDAAKQLIQSILDWKAELADLGKESLLEKLGFTAEDVTDSILSGIEDGLKLSENSLGDWSNNFGDLLKKALTQGIMESLNTKYLADFMEKFNSSMEDGALSESERLNLETLYREAVEKATADWDAVKDIFDQYSTPQMPGGLTGISASLTEETGSMLNGQVMGMRVDLKNMDQSLRIIADTNINHVNLAQLSINHLANIERNTSYNKELITIRDELKTMNRTLKDNL